MEAKISGLEAGSLGEYISMQSAGLKNMPTVIGDKYVGSFCLGCKTTNLPADQNYHGECGPILLVHATIGEGSDRVVATQLYDLLNNDKLVEELRAKYKGLKHAGSL